MRFPFRLTNNSKIVLTVGGVLFVSFSTAVAQVLPVGVDWHLTFRPATLALIAGESPYTSAAVSAPYGGAPWGLIPLIPFALLPEKLGWGFLFVSSAVIFAMAAIRLGAKPVALTAFLLSPPVLHCLLNGNLDWLPALGFILPPQLGLFLLAIKPQMGSVVAVFWLVEAWRRGGWREIARRFGPLALGLVLSLLVYGWWPLNMLKISQHTTWWEASLWPTSIPVGLALTVAALRQRRIQYAIAASPCLSTHVVFHSWSGVLLAVSASTPEMVAAVLGLWVLVGLRFMAGAGG